MSVKIKKPHPALKHGGYSATGLLPGENRATFEKLRRDLRAELRPDGALEKEVVADIARWLWRKKNLDTFRIAEWARKRYSAIQSEMAPSTTPLFDFPDFANGDWIPSDPVQVKAASEAAEARARKELGKNYKFVAMGDLATPAQMLADLLVEERVDARIDKLFRNWLC
jgi:hypothetical protein